MLVAVAGRSNGLGPVLSGNTAFPVINCPPGKTEDFNQDVWSSLKVPSGEFKKPAILNKLYKSIFNKYENKNNKTKLNLFY